MANVLTFLFSIEKIYRLVLFGAVSSMLVPVFEK